MKKLIYASLLTLLVVACNKGSKNNQSSKDSSENAVKSIFDKNVGLPMPKGTVFEEVKDEAGNTIEIKFSLPETYQIIGTASDDAEKLSAVVASKGSITCTCSGSGGCKPFAAGGKMGCIIENCSSCTGTSTALGKELDFYFIKNGELSEGSALALLADSRPIYEFEEWQQLPFVTKEEMESAEFQKVISELMTYCEKFTGSDLVAIPYTIKGKKFLINVPYTSIDQGVLYGLSVSSTSYSCSGSCKEGKCTKETAGLGQVVYCTGCNSGCKLSIK